MMMQIMSIQKIISAAINPISPNKKITERKNNKYLQFYLRFTAHWAVVLFIIIQFELHSYLFDNTLLAVLLYYFCHNI